MVMEYETDPRGAAIEFRKHLGWYAKGLHGGAELRKRLYAVTSFAEVEGIFARLPRARSERYARERVWRRRRRRPRARGRRRREARARARPARAGSRTASLPVDIALDALAQEPIESLGFATIDHHRALRQGFPEVIYGAGKTPEQVVAIAQRIAERGDGVLVTRVADDAVARAAARRCPALEHNALARTVLLRRGAAASGSARDRADRHGGHERPAGRRGGRGDRRRDGLCRRSGSRTSASRASTACSRGASALERAAVIIVVAGMDGALPPSSAGWCACR